MELLLLAGSWWIVGFTGAMMPGPVTTLIVAQSARRGFVAGPLVTLGHVGVELLMVIALFFGLGEILKQNVVAGGIGLVGGAFLLWMGIVTARDAWTGKVSFAVGNRPGTSTDSSNPFLAGIFTTLSNPYWLLWWATVGAASLITFRAFGFPGMVAFYVGHTLADWVWNNVVAFVVATGRRVMTDQIYRGILVVCGLFLVGLSLYFISSGLSFLHG